MADEVNAETRQSENSQIPTECDVKVENTVDESAVTPSESNDDIDAND